MADNVENFVARITAKDEASATIDQIAAKADALADKEAQVAVSAEDEATPVLEEVEGAVEDLEGSEAEVAVGAEDEASPVLEEVEGNVESLDGAEASVSVEADDGATEVLEEVESNVGDLDGAAATVALEAVDNATEEIESVASAVTELDGETATVTVEAAGAEEAEGALSGIGGAALGAEGLVGGLSAALGGGGLGSLVGSINPVTASVAAIGGAAVVAATQFEDLALHAKAFSTNAGIGIGDASRWIETAGDLGVSVDAVQSAMARLNREAASGKLASFGITAQDAGGRLMQVLDLLNNTTDGATRSTIAFELLGKGGALALAPLIENVDSLAERLATTPDSKLIDPQDAVDARKFADELDNLTDTIEGMSLAIGKALLPVLGPLVQGLADAASGKGGLDAATKSDGNWWDGWSDGLKVLTGAKTKADEDASDLEKSYAKVGNVVEAAGHKYVILAHETVDITGLTDQQTDAVQKLAVSHDDAGAKALIFAGQQALLQNAVAETTQAAQSTQWDAYAIGLKQAADAEKATADAAAALKEKVLEVAAAWDETASRTAAFTAASAELLPTTRNEITATAAYEAGIDSLSDSFEKNGKTVDLSTAKGRANSAAIFATGDSVNGLISQLVASGTSYDDVTTKADGYRDSLSQQLAQQGLNEDQIHEYISALGLTPEQISTRLELTGQDEAKAKLDALGVSLADVPKEIRSEYIADVKAGDYEAALKLLTDGADPRVAEFIGSADTTKSDDDLARSASEVRTATIGSEANTKEANAELELARAEKRVATLNAVAEAADAAGDLDTAAKARATLITARAETTQARSDLAALTKDETKRIFVNTIQSGTLVPKMAGGPIMEDGFYTVGEAGRETIYLPKGAHVDSAGQTMTGGAGNVTIINNNFNVSVPLGTSKAMVGAAIADALDAFYRTSSSRLRSA